VRRTATLLTLLILLALANPLLAAASPLAFPGAEGFAAHATGGRGGAVVHVTNLNDDGPGSLREAVSHGGRTVVFDVGGYVELRSILRVASDITIAGQTAPGDGIGTKNYEVSFSGSHNVIARYIRFRQGATQGQEKKSAVAMFDAHEVLLDHVSIEFGRWDTLDMNKCTNVTLQWCIIGDGITPQRFGCLCQSQDVTFTHCLFIDNHSRNPKSKGNVQFVNNVVYNWELDAYIEGASAGKNWHDIIGNYFIKGPNTKHGPFARGNENSQVYARDNVCDDNLNGTLDGKPTSRADLGPVTVLKEPFASPAESPVTIESAEAAYHHVVTEVGCSLHRDAVDARLIDDLTSLGKRGQIISAPEDVGGFGALKGGPAPKDSDGDGMPDEWETAHGLNPHDPADAQRLDPSGYTMLEMYLNSLSKPRQD
jgi:pectate lyase